jgi:SAM-dependent methyltransferase
MGFFTLELARLVGETGSVVAIDVQPKMLSALQRRAAKQGLLPRIQTRLAVPDSLPVEDLTGSVDFVLAFAVVHEMPSAPSFFQQAAAAMKPGAQLLFVEPSGHVKPAEFESSLQAALAAGLLLASRPAIRRNAAALLQKP